MLTGMKVLPVGFLFQGYRVDLLIKIILADGNRIFGPAAEDILLEDEEGVGLPLGLDLIRLGCLKIYHNESILRDKGTPIPIISLLLFLLGIFNLLLNDRYYLAIP